MGITLKGVKELQDSFGGASRNLSKELGIVVWNAGKTLKRQMARRVVEELNVPQKAVLKHINTKKVDRGGTISAVVTFNQSERTSLKAFSPKQNGIGARFKMLKSKGAYTLKGGFMGPRPGLTAMVLRGHVFTRMSKSKRLPIVKRMGVSPTAVFHFNEMMGPTLEDIDRELEKELRERIRWNKVKTSKGL